MTPTVSNAVGVRATLPASEQTVTGLRRYRHFPAMGDGTGPASATGTDRPTLVPSELQTGSGKAPTRRGGAVLYRELPTANDGAATVQATSITLAEPLGTGA